jgi:hypothetical protein
MLSFCALQDDIGIVDIRAGLRCHSNEYVEYNFLGGYAVVSSHRSLPKMRKLSLEID